jgi:AbrB family looped-hinge helix DNA binding protein
VERAGVRRYIPAPAADMSPVWRRWAAELSLSQPRTEDINVSMVTVSPKFQVVIPREIRKALRLAPGQKLQALRYHDRIEFLPVRSIRDLRGFLRGIDTSVPRVRDRV